MQPSVQAVFSQTTYCKDGARYSPLRQEMRKNIVSRNSPENSPGRFVLGFLPSLKLTWHLKIDPWKRKFLLETIIFRCYVSFRECTSCFRSRIVGPGVPFRSVEWAQHLIERPWQNASMRRGRWIRWWEKKGLPLNLNHLIIFNS